MASMFFAYDEEVFQPLLYYTSEVDLAENINEVRNKLQTWNIVTATRTAKKSIKMRLRKELYYLTTFRPRPPLTACIKYVPVYCYGQLQN